MAHDLLQIINQEYNIPANRLKPFGPVWQIDSAQGRFGLKKTGSSAERLNYTAAILSQIKQAGFVSLVLPEISQKGLPFFEFNNQYYQLFQWLPGNHPSFTDPGSIKKCAQLFAGLHRISRLAPKLENCRITDFTSPLEQRAVFLEKTKLFLKNKPQLNRVDRVLLSWSDYFLTQARYALSGLNKTKPALKSEVIFGFCHNDPASRNIIVDDGQWFLIDFELSACDWFVFELAKLIGRVLQVNNWRPLIYDLMIDAYARERTITDWERVVLPYLLCFPQHFWRICSQRFEEKLKWSERRFATKLWKITDKERQRLIFLKFYLPDLPM